MECGGWKILFYYLFIYILLFFFYFFNFSIFFEKFIKNAIEFLSMAFIYI